MSKPAEDTETIVFDALVSQVRTLADSSIRIQLDLPEGCIYQAAWLMQVKQDEGQIRVTVNLNQE